MTEPRWTYVTPADGPSTKLHLPGCRMMTETDRLDRTRPAGDYWQGRPPWELGDLLCQHCWKQVDPLVKIRAKSTDFYHFPSDLCVTPDDVDWLIAEVERFRSSS